MKNFTQLFPCNTRICLDKFKDLFCSLTTSMTTFLTVFFDHLLTDFPVLKTAGLGGEIETDVEDGTFVHRPWKRIVFAFDLAQSEMT